MGMGTNAFPTIGKRPENFSNDWKKCGKKFQRLENSPKKFPMIGKWRKVSPNDWRRIFCAAGGACFGWRLSSRTVSCWLGLRCLDRLDMTAFFDVAPLARLAELALCCVMGSVGRGCLPVLRRVSPSRWSRRKHRVSTGADHAHGSSRGFALPNLDVTHIFCRTADGFETASPIEPLERVRDDDRTWRREAPARRKRVE